MPRLTDGERRVLFLAELRPRAAILTDRGRPVTEADLRAARAAWIHTACELGRRGGTLVTRGYSELEQLALSWCLSAGGRGILLLGEHSGPTELLDHLRACYGGRVVEGERPPDLRAGLLRAVDAVVLAGPNLLRADFRRLCQARGVPVLDLMADPGSGVAWIARCVSAALAAEIGEESAQDR